MGSYLGVRSKDPVDMSAFLRSSSESRVRGAHSLGEVVVVMDYIRS